jgi:hypothetical protein
MKLPLITGAYSARSLIAACQRCVNLYMERNPQDSPFPFTHYPMPGLRLLATAPQAVCRGAYKASNGDLFMVYGSGVYYVSPSYVFTSIATVNQATTPVSMKDNGTTMLIVDGSSRGTAVTLATHAAATITQESFYGGDAIAEVDGYFILNRPGTNQWYISAPFDTTFDALDFAAKTGYSDTLVTVIATRREIYLMGEQTVEVWFNEGNTDFTFGRMPGVFIEHGCLAKYSVATMDGSIFWLSRDQIGGFMVMRTQQYMGIRVSTHAIEQEIAKYSTVTDAVGYCMQLNGHNMYVLKFPTANKTWVYDMSTDQWNEWLSVIDNNGTLAEHRGYGYAFWNGLSIIGDSNNSNLYALDLDTYTENGTEIIRLRSFPHIVHDSNRVMYRELVVDMESGNGDDAALVDGLEPQVSLRWSDTRGASWGNPVVASLGATGEYLTNIQYQRLGVARDRVFEVSWSFPLKTALNGAYIQIKDARQ